MKQRTWKQGAKLLAALVITLVLTATAAAATQTNFDTANFKGLVLTTSVGTDQVSVKLYKGFNNEDANLMTPVYTEQTADGGMAYYYEVTAEGRYRCVSRSPSGNARYIIHRSIYMSAEEAATKTVCDVTPAKRSTSGWDPPLVYTYTDEVLSGPYASSKELWPDYADVFTTPAFKAGRNPHQQTTQTEMMNFINGLNGSNDNMYVYILGKGDGSKAAEKFDIPIVIFTKVDLSGAKTWEEAAALVKADSDKTGKVMIHYQAQIHGSEPASCEGALAMMQRFDGAYGEKLLDKMNIYVIPRLNPYGAYKSSRNTYYNGASDIDPNGDFARLRMVETQMRQNVFNHFDPDISFDGHEYLLDMEWVTMKHKDIMLAVRFMPFHTEQFQQLNKTLASQAMGKLTENGLAYGWYTDVVNGAGISTGAGNAAYRGTLNILMESHGITGGRNYYERRVMGQVSVVEGVLDYVYDNAAEVRSVIRGQKQATIDAGKTYEESDKVILEFAKVNDASLALPGNSLNLATGKLTATTFPAEVWRTVVRSRTAPTAYVIPAGESWTQGVLNLLSMQGISYTFVPSGSGIMLQQYTQVAVNSSGRIIEAGLTGEQLFDFPQGAYVITMAQYTANVLGQLMEPDVTQSTTNTVVQSGRVPVTDGMIPIYRYIQDLNADGSITYIAAAPAPQGLTAVKAPDADSTGKIIGLDAAKLYEYRAEDQRTYTQVPAGSTEIADLAPGKYYVRFAATAGEDASAEAPCLVEYEKVNNYTVYLKSGATTTGDGYSETAPVSTIAAAYEQLGKLMADAPAGKVGKIILLDTYTLPSNRNDFPAHDYPVHIKGLTGTEGIHYPGSSASDTRVVAFNGDTTLSNMKISLGGNSNYNYFCATGHKLVIGENVVCTPSTYSDGNGYFCLVGGDYRGTFASTDLTVHSGTWRQIYAGNYASGTITGDVNLVVDGGTITNYIQATYKGTVGGDIYMDIQNTGGTSCIYGGAVDAGKTSGDVTVRLGENVGQKKVYACSSASTFSGTFTVIADGVDLTGITITGRSSASSSTGAVKYMPATLVLNQGQMADVVGNFVNREDATIVLGCEQTKAVTIPMSCNLDMNGHNASDVTVAAGQTLTVTNNGQTRSVLTVDGNAVVAAGFEEKVIIKQHGDPDEIPALPGDVDGSGEKNTEDAVYLLLHVLFGENQYPVADGTDLDINNDSKVDTEDAVYLLLNVLFGDASYPI